MGVLQVAAAGRHREAIADSPRERDDPRVVRAEGIRKPGDGMSELAVDGHTATLGPPSNAALTRRRCAFHASASSSNFVTVVQLRAVAVTPSPRPASSAQSFDLATPVGCHA